jgi:hypothetical protein
MELKDTTGTEVLKTEAPSPADAGTSMQTHGIAISFSKDEKTAFITTLQMIDELRGANTPEHWTAEKPARRISYFAAKTVDGTYTISIGGLREHDHRDLVLLREAFSKAQDLVSKPDELHAFATTFRRSTPAYVDQLSAHHQSEADKARVEAGR